MQEFKVPGVSVGVIRNAAVVISKGYGWRDVDKRLPMTPRTIMPIGSCTKSFTVTLMAILSDRGKLDWREPVRTYLPDFQLRDPVATELMTPTDLVDHLSGLPRHERMGYGRSRSREDIYRRLRFLEPSQSFRQGWQYNNLMYMTAGYLLEKLASKPWDALLREEIFVPLGMHRSSASVQEITDTDDHSLPYMEIDGKVATVPYRSFDYVRPAGAINSNIEEMLRYIQMHIDQGEHQGKQIISRRMARQMQSLHAAMPVELASTDPELGPGGYGLGVNVSSYRGHKLVAHPGDVDGFAALMSWMPDDRIGVVVITNLSGTNPLPSLLQRNLYDRLLALAPVDWYGRTKKQLAETEQRRKQAEAEHAAERVPGTSPSHPLSAYVGTYEHPGYGIVQIAQQRDQLVLALDQWTVPLEHYHYDVFQMVKPPAGHRNLELAETPGVTGLTKVSFAQDKKGRLYGDRKSVV